MSSDFHDTATELRMATFRLARRLRQQRAEDSLSDAQFSVLTGIRINGPMTITALAEREHVTTPSMTNAVNQIEQAGYVVRVSDAADRRRSYVELTEAGSCLVTQTVRLRDAALADMLAELELTAAERKTLRAASEIMTRVATHRAPTQPNTQPTAPAPTAPAAPASNAAPPTAPAPPATGAPA